MYCPECGESIADDVRYCRHCGAEVNEPDQDVDTGVDEVGDIDRLEKVEHQCQDCGEMLRSGEPPCKYCGGMNIETRPIEPGTANQQGPTVEATPTAPAGQQTRNTQFYLGAVAGVLAVVFVPFVFVFVAIPESIMAMRGSSIQNYLGRDAQDNPFVSGSLLIMRWFGNFLIFLFVLGLLLGILLAL